MKFNEKYSRLQIFIIGLLFVVTGQLFQYTIIKISIDALIVNFGSMIALIGLSQWIFDHNMRKENIYEAIRAIKGNEMLTKIGVANAVNNTRDIEDKDEWKNAKRLVICSHYSSDFIVNNIEMIKYRIANNKKTELWHIDSSGLGAKQMKEAKFGHLDIEVQIEKMKSIVIEQLKGKDNIIFRQFENMLKYTFILTEKSIWVRFITNTKGHIYVPGFKLNAESDMYEWFKEDIERLPK